MDCRDRKNRDSGTGRLCNLLKSQWRMVSVSSFCELIEFHGLTDRGTASIINFFELHLIHVAGGSKRR
jgi:hypothetical protein